ncbi:U3 snoRNP protein [Coemansia pectinata]|uniref:U3 snoRNP protein n=1 Tax=Coemansia pectinata TaxID=1052879 RepID=A0A9W8GS71_9FUNG|nr:U3 snoRNP protein [Coemansia pectinata]
MAAGGSVTKRKPRAAEATKPKSKSVAQVEADEVSDIDMASDSDDSQLDDGDDNDEEMAEPMLAGENASGENTTKTAEHKKGLPGAKPTNAEIMALNETSLLFKSNLFKLQVDELLSETSVAANTKPTRGLDAALKQIRDVLTSLGDVKEMSTDSASNYVRKQSKASGKLAMIPFPDPAPAVGMPISFAFKAPKVVNIVGSYPLGMAAQSHSGFNVDVVVQMPAELFQERDYLNFRYFYKRAFYVAVLLIGLQQHSAISELFDVEFSCLRSDTRLPIVVLRPKSGVKHLGKLGCTVRILPSIAHDTLPLKRLSPERNYVRPSYISNAKEAESDEANLPATPQYSATILSDALLLTHMKYLFETTEMCPEFPRAATLLRIWIGQRTAAGRQLGSHKIAGSQRLNGFVLTMLLAWLLRCAHSGSSSGPKLSGTMSAYQLFKGAIEFLAVHDFEEAPIQFGAEANMDAFGDNFGAVFVDPTDSLNLLSGVQEWELAELRMEARVTALDINHHVEDRFARVFLSAALTDISAKYDHVFRLEVDLSKFLSAKHGAELKPARRLAELEFGHPVAAVQNRIASFLSSALEKHARLVAVHPCADACFEDGVKAMRRHVFFIGVVADAAEARRLVDLGPNPDAQPQEASRFRAYWGERAELRRFRDGAIRLATVWGAGEMSMEKRAAILPRMVAYLLRRHFSVRAVPEVMQADDLFVVDTARPNNAKAFGLATDPLAGSLFCMSTRITSFAQTIDIGADSADQISFEAAVSAFDEFQREIKQLDEQMPLRVVSLHAVSPGLRYASLVPPKPLSMDQGGDDSFIEPLHVVVEFASSNKWPDDITALHKIKTAFLLRLGESYTALHPESRVELVNRFHGRGAADGLLTGGSSLTLGAHENMDYEGDNCIDIKHVASGLTFRLSMLCDREGELLAKKASDMKLAGLAAHAEAIEMAHRRWTRNHIWRPRHHRQVLDLCQRHHPAVSMTIRLLKRWLSRHMLLGQAVGVPEELAELLASHVFTDISGGLSEPATGCAGFVRCLQLLAEWKWSEDLFAVDFSADSREATKEDDGVVAKTLAQGVWVSSGMPVGASEMLQKAFTEAKEHSKLKGSLRVATENDPEATWWGTVSPVLTRRLRTLAKASLECIVSCLDAGSDAQLPQVFTTPLNDYDFIIKLHRDVVCRKYEQLPKFAALSDRGAVEADYDSDSDMLDQPEIFKNLLPTMQSQQRVPGKLPQSKRHANPFHQPGMVGFDPVALYVRDLVNVYGDSMLLFNDVYGGHIIAGLWNPAVTSKPVPFTANILANIQPAPEAKAASSRPMVKYNIEAVAEEMARLGEGIVDSISVQRS